MAIVVSKKTSTVNGTRYTSANNIYTVTERGNFNASPAVVSAVHEELSKIKEHLGTMPMLRKLLADYEVLSKGGEELAQQQILAAMEKKASRTQASE